MGKKMEPFKAWIMWHPELGFSDTCLSFLSAEDVKWGFLNDEKLSRPSSWEGAQLDGWRIVEVLVTPVGNEEAGKE